MIVYDKPKWFCITIEEGPFRDFYVTCTVDWYKMEPCKDMPLYEKVRLGELEVESAISHHDRLQWSTTYTPEGALQELVKLNIQNCKNEMDSLIRRGRKCSKIDGNVIIPEW